MAKDKNTTPLPVVQEGDLSSLLQKYREKAGYSVPQMADALCLSEETLVNLEDENFQSLPVPPYVRGYLRNYASLAEESPEELVSLYESLRGANPNELEHHFKTSSTIFTTSKSNKISPVIIQVLFLVLLLGIIAGVMMIPSVNKWLKTTWESFSTQSATPNNTDNPLLTGTMPVPTTLPLDEVVEDEKAIAPSNIEKISENDNNDKPVETEKKPETEPETASSDQATDKPKEIEEVITEKKPESDDATEVSSDRLIAIKLVFNKEVWMRIRDKNNKTVFEGQNQSGKEKNLKLKKPLTFRVGNAQGLSLFVDGKPVNLNSYINGSIANFTLE